MITVTLFTKNGGLNGFESVGHSGYNEKGKDIVCAAVSSALFMTVNTITEIYKIIAEVVSDEDGYMKLTLSDFDARQTQDLLRGLELHLMELANQYPEHIKVIHGGVDNA